MTISLPADSLRTSLEELALQISQDVQRWRESGRLVMSPRGYTRRPDYSLHYSVDPMITNDMTFEHEEEETWDRDNFLGFYKENVENSSAHNHILLEVDVIGQPSQLLRAFAERVAYESLSPGAESTVQKHVGTLLRDLYGLDHRYTARMWLTGIKPKEELVRVSERLSLRRPEYQDMQERIPDETINFAHAFQRQTWFSGIAELQVAAPQAFGVQVEGERLVVALRLFRLGAVSASRVDISAESFSAFSNTRLSASSHATRLEYELSRSDAIQLERFLNVVAPTLPTPYGVSVRSPDFLSTALDWYADALLAAKPIEGTLASAVACLEALFLADNPNTEITHRLVQRVAALLGHLGWPSLEIRKLLLQAYEIRSRYVHGSAQNPKKKLTHEELQDLFRKTAEFARLACLIILQMVRTHGIDHQTLLGTLNDGMIEDDARNQMKALCSKVEYGRKVT